MFEAFKAQRLERTNAAMGITAKHERFKNGSEVPREMGINERAINRVNRRMHAIPRHFQGDGLLTGWLTDTRLFIWGTHVTSSLPPSSMLHVSPPDDRRSYSVWRKKHLEMDTDGEMRSHWSTLLAAKSSGRPTEKAVEKRNNFPPPRFYWNCRVANVLIIQSCLRF